MAGASRIEDTDSDLHQDCSPTERIDQQAPAMPLPNHSSQIKADNAAARQRRNPPSAAAQDTPQVGSTEVTPASASAPIAQQAIPATAVATPTQAPASAPAAGGHPRELIKPDLTVARQTRVLHTMPRSPSRSPVRSSRASRSPGLSDRHSPRIVTAVDEEQLHRRLLASKSAPKRQSPATPDEPDRQPRRRRSLQSDRSNMSIGSSFSFDRSSRRRSQPPANENDNLDDNDDVEAESPPPAEIIIPASVSRELSQRSEASATTSGPVSADITCARNRALPVGNAQPGQQAFASPLSREQLEYGPLLKPGEVQVLYRSPEATMSYRQLKDEHAKLVAPDKRQSPICLSSTNTTYSVLDDKPLMFDYPTKIENLRLTNTGYSWQVKIPYQISMITTLHGATLASLSQFKLDQFHCHWGPSNDIGSEHTVDNRQYAAEIHFVHYNMEKYHTVSIASRHSDGLVVLAVFLDSQAEHQTHAELEKVTAYLRNVPLKGEHAIIRQAVRLDNLLPANKSYWSYSGSLTTQPFYESVKWFVLKTPVKCSAQQIQRFRQIKSSLKHAHGHHIVSNHRKPQPLNGRIVETYDE